MTESDPVPSASQTENPDSSPPASTSASGSGDTQPSQNEREYTTDDIIKMDMGALMDANPTIDELRKLLQAMVKAVEETQVAARDAVTRGELAVYQLERYIGAGPGQGYGPSI